MWEKVLQEPLAVVFVHASWCGHCKALWPLLKEVARKHRGSVPTYAVEESVYKTLQNTTVEVTSFPKVFQYTHGTKTKEENGGPGNNPKDKVAKLEQLYVSA
jgi:thiol-disulfide isomerase/thioredoxin